MAGSALSPQPPSFHRRQSPRSHVPLPAALINEPLSKRRNPIAVVASCYITFGIYFLYWYGVTNAEVRRHDSRLHVTPVLGRPGSGRADRDLVSGYNTSHRVRRLEFADGMPDQISPVLSVLFMIFLGGGYPIQVQMHLNRQWDYHRTRRA
jgi:hypothetical protein